ncbi:MAG: hypothetical protein HY094_09445 [Candidatus Melainabacteria bacterium]|nr:hypothetical protein [Candidatus Melainabacteria bacterium]
MIPLFDSLAHPTLTGSWINKNLNASFSKLITDMKKANYVAACAVGLSGIEGYDHKFFIEECKKYDCFIPVAGIDPKKSIEDLETEISYVAKLGFKGVKIHPRNAGIKLDYKTLPDILKFTKENNLVTMLCTYSHSALSLYPDFDPFYSLVKLLKTESDAKVILLHGGDVNLLKYAELVRKNPNLILDLSYTIMRYENSSIDLDIKFLLSDLDRRVCIGTDYPEYSHEALRRRFEKLSLEISWEKLENIGFKNLQSFFNCKLRVEVNG